MVQDTWILRGRCGCVDSVFHAGTSPYAYCLGNPVVMVDPDGRVEYKEDGTVDVDFEADQF